MAQGWLCSRRYCSVGCSAVTILPKFPEPPSADWLASNLPPDIHRLHEGVRLWRVYFRGGKHPISWNDFRNFGPTTSRFDHHLPPPRQQERSIVYASAEQGPPCFAEVFQDSRVIDRSRNNPWLVAFELIEPLELLDFTFAWPTQAGASLAINSGPRPRAQRWSRAIYEAYPSIHGIRYASSMLANAPLVALFERSQSALPRSPLFNRALSDQSLLDAIRNVGLMCGYAVV